MTNRLFFSVKWFRGQKNNWNSFKKYSLTWTIRNSNWFFKNFCSQKFSNLEILKTETFKIPLNTFISSIQNYEVTRRPPELEPPWTNRSNQVVVLRRLRTLHGAKIEKSSMIRPITDCNFVWISSNFSWKFFSWFIFEFDFVPTARFFLYQVHQIFA